jgi:signal-transduction protein with cAMP-binding, CBS, and nucleotidyltransferase domain
MPETQPDGNTGTLEELEVRPLTWVSESDTLATVARALLDSGASCAVLTEPPLRIVTERDLVGAWANGRSGTDEIARIAGTHERWASRDATVLDAATLMVNLGIRHLVVVDTGRPVGVVSMVEVFSSLLPRDEPENGYAEYAAVVLHSTTP